MEASSQPLSIESFSYRWLVNIRSSFESRPNSFRTSLDEASFIEMDPTMPPSKRFFSSSSSRPSHDFNFPSPSPSPSPSLPLVHADQLISNGYLLPAYTASAAASPVVEPLAKPVSSCSLRNSCRRLSRKVFEKYLNLLRPICRRIQGKVEKLFHGGSSRPISRETHQWRRSCDSESSIYDAVLHCKRSIGK
ncbi:probable membrane-associated kinase regulator 6 [Cucurbita pepo subsp. pepo]|uniref:probable membrane-associated kinase regulator 6 n=1 Tax=Cucurbita pepo subsp. pepo TaxID=3664 RepID=UPI000C9D8CC9|nr:probable membrane-associated kinase regulator 6 [Cucurbita pepo subsp. pepo]